MRNWESDGSEICLEATSAKMLSTPAMETRQGGDEWVCRCSMASPRRRRWAELEEADRRDMLVTQLTDGELSQWMMERT